MLLPASVLLRRGDPVAVIGLALLAKAGGAGHQRIAEQLGLPASTVRGWLRRIAAVADRVLAAVAAELGAEFMPPAPLPVRLTSLHRTVSASRTYGRYAFGLRPDP